LDLSKENDRLYYEHLKGHPVYVLGPDPHILLINQYQDAIDDVEKQELAIKAKNIIMELVEEDLRDFARIIGVDSASRVSPIVIKNKVYEMCDEKPSFIIEMWNHPEKSIHILVKKAIEKGVIAIDGAVYKFNQATVGGSPDEVILYLVQNPNVIPSITNRIKNS